MLTFWSFLIFKTTNYIIIFIYFDEATLDQTKFVENIKYFKSKAHPEKKKQKNKTHITCAELMLKNMEEVTASQSTPREQMYGRPQQAVVLLSAWKLDTKLSCQQISCTES